MKLTVPSARIGAARIAQADIGQLSIGTISVGQLNIADARVGITAGRASLRNMSVTVDLDFVLEWRIGIDGPGPLDIEESDTSNLGGITFDFTVGDVEIPGLRNINLDIGALTASNLQVEAAPVTNVRLRSLVADGIQATALVVPTAGFQLTTLGLASLDLADLGVPAAAVQSASVQRVRGEPITIPALSLRGLVLPSAASNDISSDALNIPFQQERSVLPALDVGFFRAELRVEATATSHVERMLMTGVRANARVESVELRNVTLPYDATNITLADIGLDTIEVPSIGLV